MTNEQINIAIAKVCPRLVEWHDGVPYHLGEWSAVGEGNEFYAEFRPATDLNAMHEVEALMDNNQWELWHRIVSQWTDNPSHATARQRAEAFLRTIEAWKEARNE